MTFFSRILQRFRTSRYVGQDLIGNRFYEQNSPNGTGRPKRIVQYRNPEDVWQYIGGGKRLAIQWSSWLAHTRIHPPTLEELQIDAARQERVAANVALIEARDREEREQVLRLQQQQREAVERPQGDSTSAPQQETQPPHMNLPQDGTSPHTESTPPEHDPSRSLPQIGTSADSLESWTPRSRARGG